MRIVGGVLLQSLKMSGSFFAPNCPNRLPLGLGSSVVPSDPSDEGVFIAQVLPDGLISRDGRIRPGSRLLEVNGNWLLGATLREAIKVSCCIRAPSIFPKHLRPVHILLPGYLKQADYFYYFSTNTPILIAFLMLYIQFPLY
ncbi:unnamed protein product [Protopolystoma xenopodis]|uniref:PDZ domain-containing protein n=1 Tax=Protopolystoma xenopodis TaxID=117903 RepID=A0A448WEV6_9PLAT|nr:unnamed protein product [Protopolystoma xenopodis]